MKTQNKELLHSIIHFLVDTIIFFAVYAFLFIAYPKIARFLNGAKPNDLIFIVSSWIAIDLCCAYLSFFIVRFILINFFYFKNKRKFEDEQTDEEENQRYSIKQIVLETLGNKFNMVLVPIATVSLLLCLLNTIKINESSVTYKSFFDLKPHNYAITDIHSITIDVYRYKDDVRCQLFLHFEDNKVDIWQDATISSPSASQLISALNLIKTNNKNVIFKSDWEPTQKILERCGGKKKEAIFAMYEYAKSFEKNSPTEVCGTVVK